MTKHSLLTVKDVVRIFNISRRTVYYWIKKGILHPLTIGGVLRFHPEDIEHLVERHRHHALRRKKRVLAIDDDILVRESLKILLGKSGIEAVVVSSGREALELISKEVFDLILTDIRMPQMNGIETLREIRKLRSEFGKPPLPEIILTAYDDPKIKEEAKKLGVREFIVKPFEMDQFISAIQKNLN